jgi:AcrR family transcriptional regulator
MSRPKISDKRIAILNAATRTIFVRGLGASTAGIAKEAGVATGSLFNYFDTKTDLLNELYLELKREIVSAAMKTSRKAPSYAFSYFTFGGIGQPGR